MPGYRLIPSSLHREKHYRLALHEGTAPPPSFIPSEAAYRPAEKIPVRDTAPQSSGPSLSQGSGCSAPAGYRLELLFPETAIPHSSSPSPGDRPSAFLPLLAESSVCCPETAAPVSSGPLPAETGGTAPPVAAPLPSTDQKKELLGDGGSLRGEGPFELWPKGSSPATKYPAHFPLPCSSSCSQRASRSAASTERGPGRANRCSSTSSTRPERTALRPR